MLVVALSLKAWKKEKLGLCMDELPRAKRFELVRKYAAELDGRIRKMAERNTVKKQGGVSKQK